MPRWAPGARPVQRAGTVLFDLDGTLVDSAPDLADALDTLLASEGHAPLGLAITRALIGHGMATLVQRGFARHGVALSGPALAAMTERFLKIYTSHLSRKTRPYPGATEAIVALRTAGWRLAVCTNKLEASARGILHDLGLASAFAIVAGPDTFGIAKPAPGHLLNCLDGANRGLPAVMIGDSEVDSAAARAAGLPFVLVRWGYAARPADEIGADARVAHFSEIPGVVATLAARLEPPGAARAGLMSRSLADE